MSKEMTIIALGIWIIITPYLGVPGSWRTVLLVLSGLGIAVTGFLLRGESIARGAGSRTSRSYVESPATPQSLHEPAHEDSQGINSLN
jgi:hypothetical protein